MPHPQHRTLLAVTTLVIIVHSVRTYPAPLEEDQACSLPDGGGGVCKRLNDCPSALAGVRNHSNLRPVRCGFIGFEEIVCCPRSRSQTTRPRNSGQRKSEEACRRYRQMEVKRIGYFILGGEEAKDGEFPHMAALGFLSPGETSMSWRCGGTLISDRYVLTAAHCLTNTVIGQPKVVRLGQSDMNAVSSDASDYPVDAVLIHPRYKKKTNYDDIALVRLSRPVTFSQDVSPACLYSRGDIPDGELLATGWGATDNAGWRRSSRLLKASLRAVPHETCKPFYKEGTKIPQGLLPSMLCARDPAGNADTCQGDSGGPLQVLEDSKSSVYSVVGITSFGPNPCGGKKPSIYTLVSSYVDWVESVVWP